MDGEAVTEF